MTGEFSESWLSLREPADAAARAAELLPLIPGPVRVIRDLGCGTGSLGRWLAPKLPTPQHWVMMDRDPALLDYARSHMPFEGVTVETVLGDVTSLTAADLDGTDLVTCSALLDLLTEAEVTGLVAACAGSRTPALFTLSVTGEVTLDPPVPAVVGEAFNAHQRRVTDGRRLLGPSAASVAIAAFEKAGATVVPRPSAWHLQSTPLLDTWLHGWLSAAAEQSPGLQTEAYSKDRRAATVGHVDLLAIFG
ncbi:class I SAM-dependent methyltransferase [Actinoplanes sp. TBRC 11911]|uniref:class I SAM-dependent methyltransferase n=1 Tax=Actinoplanes sp. TBRC 11911 TaxID=2729386 RepID=UPI00145FC733|nr:class I SAM-dependent methyltransferase [Actinoplanes sp. TBRC 11911]NMO54719.1 class I SAM-dependent methyltransferase [Actinoplanes sp. TBRC 11911]